MQIVIDIPEDTYKRIKGLVDADYFEHDINGFSQRAIANGTPIPDNATNGDVIKVMFNEEDIWDIQTALNTYSEITGWWDSLYCED